MFSIRRVLQRSIALMGIDETRCVSCFQPYSPIRETSFHALYEKHITVTNNTQSQLWFHHQWNLEPQLCPDCLHQLAPRTEGYCPICGMLYAKAAGAPSRCSSCIFSPPPWTHITLYSGYEGLLRKMLLHHKFHGRLDAGLTLARLLAARYSCKTTIPVAVIPIPLHNNRLLYRGHNQTMLCAKLIAQKINVPLLPKILRRNRETTPQATLSKKERARNLSGAFSAHIPAPLINAHVLLIDDIATTGSTLQQATQTLLDGGAGSVEIAIMAKTPEPQNVIPEAR